jgi:hypothetical protein
MSPARLLSEMVNGMFRLFLGKNISKYSILFLEYTKIEL